MILINLLPHREEKRRRRKQAFFAALGVAALAGAAMAGAWYLVVLEMTHLQQSRNEYLRTEIARLEAQIKDIASLRTEIEALKARQKVVEDFQIDRNMPVHLLNELVRQTPEGVYLSSIRQDGQGVVLAGVAQTNERVSEFLRNTAYNSTWLERPELVEIKAAQLSPTSRETKRLFEFSVRLTLRRPQDLEAHAAQQRASDAVGRPAAGASAAMAGARAAASAP